MENNNTDEHLFSIWFGLIWTFSVLSETLLDTILFICLIMVSEIDTNKKACNCIQMNTIVEPWDAKTIFLVVLCSSCFRSLCLELCSSLFTSDHWHPLIFTVWNFEATEMVHIPGWTIVASCMMCHLSKISDNGQTACQTSVIFLFTFSNNNIRRRRKILAFGSKLNISVRHSLALLFFSSFFLLLRLIEIFSSHSPFPLSYPLPPPSPPSPPSPPLLLRVT
jgi:hypothetical protein